MNERQNGDVSTYLRARIFYLGDFLELGLCPAGHSLLPLLPFARAVLGAVRGQDHPGLRGQGQRLRPHPVRRDLEENNEGDSGGGTGRDEASAVGLKGALLWHCDGGEVLEEAIAMVENHAERLRRLMIEVTEGNQLEGS